MPHRDSIGVTGDRRYAHKDDSWISVDERLPTKPGWYEIKTAIGNGEAPFVNSSAGNLVWILPDPSRVTHWKEK